MSVAVDEAALEHRAVACNGIELHLVLAGPPEGRPVLLLHGFPEFWYGWHRQIEALAAAGCRVIVPDLARLSLERCRQGRLEWLPEAGHWLHHEEPARVNALLRAFLAEPGEP